VKVEPPSIDALRRYVKENYGQEALDELHELEQKWFTRREVNYDKHQTRLIGSAGKKTGG